MNYAIILAAGYGKRMKVEAPKASLPLLSKPMISYLVDNISKTSIEKIITVVGYKKEIIEDILKDKSLYAFQENLNGTAGALQVCEDLIKDLNGFSLILNGDCPLIDDEIINDMIETYIDNKSDLTLATFKTKNPFGYGRIKRDEKGNVLSIIEEKDATSEEKKIEECNAGLYIISNKYLFKYLKEIKNNNAKGEYYLTDIVSIFNKNKKKISSYTPQDQYKLTGVNTLLELSNLEKELKLKINESLLLKGIYIENPDTVIISPDVKIESGVKIYQNTKIIGSSIISKNSIIGPNSIITNSKIGQDTKVESSTIEDSIIGKNNNIGPYSHIRMNSNLKDNIRCGNYVEIKNSEINNDTKIAHLTYIGDSKVGKNVNFGCGTVTVNFDGKEKNKTIIGNNCFIGCNTNLIAPVKVGDNVFIAAGSTITDNLDDNDFVVARSKMVVKKNYAKKYIKKKD